MQMRSIKVENYRSIKQSEINLSSFNILVGQNNHGKTNFFEALNWFFNGIRKGESIEDIRFGQSGADEVLVEIEFNGAQSGANSMKNESNKTKMLNVLGDSDSVIIKRSSVDPKNRKIKIGDDWLDRLPTGFDKALNDFLPKFEYIDTKKFFDEVSKYNKTSPIGLMLSGVLTALLEDSEQYREFMAKFSELFEDDTSDVRVELNALSNQVKVYLEKQFPDCTKITFEVKPPIFEDLLKSFETSIDDGVETSASEKGDGMQRALMLAILQAFADYRKQHEDQGKSFIFCIDEAELHLHPTAQRNLKNVMLDLSRQGDQIFLSTHSSVLVADEVENQQIFKVEKENKITDIKPVENGEKPYIIYELLGGSPADLLLPRNFLIVEGRTEVELLARVIKRHYSDKPPIQVIPAKGDLFKAQRTLYAISHVYKALSHSIYKDKAGILFDKPESDTKLNELKQLNPNLETNNQLHEIPVSSIEEYYPNNWKRTREQVESMGSESKWKLGRKVGNEIDKDVFESEMTIVFNALNATWENAFK